MKLRILFLFALIFLAFATRVLAQAEDVPKPDPLILTEDENRYPLGLHLELLEDASGELTIEDVSSAEFDSQFVPSRSEVPNLGFTNSAYWVRFQLRNDSSVTQRWLLELAYANMHFVDLYRPLSSGGDFEVTQTGALRPPSTRDVLHPHIVFDLNIPTQGQQTIYLRFLNGASMTLPITLWEPVTFFAISFQEQIWEGIFLGILLGLLGYNLFLLFSLRDVSYLYLVFLLAGIVLYDVGQNGLLDVTIVPSLYYTKSHIIPLATALIFMSLILFNDSFVSAKTLLPKFHLLNVVFVGVWVVLGLMTFLISYHNLALIMPRTIVLTIAAVATTVAIAWWKGFRADRFLLIAWIGLLAGILLFILTRMGLVISNNITENFYRISFVWVAVCWSLALADRINMLKAETESTNRKLQDSENRLLQTLEAMPVGVVVYGTDHRPTFFNKRTTEILSNRERGIGPLSSFERTLVEAMSYYSFHITGSDQAYPIEKFPVYRALLGETSSADDIEADLVDWHVPLEVWASPVFDSSGNIESAVVAFQDISRRKQKDAELAEYHKHLELLVQERTKELEHINEQLKYEMVEREALEQLLQKRIKWLSAIGLGRQNIRGKSDLPAVLETLLEVIRQLLDAGMVFFFRWEERSGHIELLSCPMPKGLTSEFEEVKTSFQKDSPLRRELKPGNTIVLSVDEVASKSVSLGEYMQKSGWQTLLLSPMFSGELIIGVIGMVSPFSQKPGPARIELITKMTLDLVNLAQEAHLLDQSRALVATEERNRLARDLHDSVTQVLFSASLVAEVLPQIWRRDAALAMQSLEELRRLTRGALAEMRTMLLELRPSAVVKSPLPELLTQLTEASTSRAQLPFKLFIEKTPVLPKDVHTGFYRIAQESLNNVAKHAQASQVALSLSAVQLSPDLDDAARYEVKLIIEDDGVGLPANNEKALGNLGMSIMRERAADIQATLTFDSQIGKGTRVTLIWCGNLGKEL